MDELYIPSDFALSKRQKALYEDLVEGIDNQLLETMEWLDTNEAKRLWNKKQKEIDKMWDDLDLKSHMDDITKENIENEEEYINQFYKIGKDLGEKELKHKMDFTNADKKALKFLKDYNYDLIKNVNDDIAHGVRKVITEAVASGKHPTEVVADLMELPFKPNDTRISVKTRCELIARTESARALNTGTLQSYYKMGVTEVDIITSGTDSVCDECLELEANSPYPVSVAMRLLPAHPGCCCSFAAVTESIADEPVDNPLIADLTP